MRLDKADDDINALRTQALAFLQHLERLADAGREAEVNLEPAALLLANQREEILGRGPFACRVHVDSSLARGNTIRNTLPSPGRLSQLTRPPCAVTTSRTMASPRPVPGS